MRLIFLFVLFCSLRASAGDSTHLYDPNANVQKDVAAALAKAKKEKKHVLLQIGGNWCVWCYRFNSFMEMDPTLKKILDNNYVVYHLNYSPENKNLDYLKKLGFPQRFGFPVLVVLDADGNRLHTQDSSLLDKGYGYDKDKVKNFLMNWAPAALDEVFYRG
ncbi:MAG TPA: thioredoxin family protein [Flavisolibacter sp.]|nr:thioredoxin family protein [Flavisolibacter sp.]